MRNTGILGIVNILLAASAIQPQGLVTTTLNASNWLTTTILICPSDTSTQSACHQDGGYPKICIIHLY
jgi:hypothetical protein